MTPTVDEPQEHVGRDSRALAPKKADYRGLTFALATIVAILGMFVTLDARMDAKVATAVATLQSQMAQQASDRAELLLQEVRDRKAADSDMEKRYIKAQEVFNQQLSRLADAIDKLNSERRLNK